MLAVLAFIVTLGFVVGAAIYLVAHSDSVRRELRAFAYPIAALIVIAVLVTLALVGLAGMRAFVADLSVYRLKQDGICVASFVVGSFAGHWFFASESVAYRGLFIAGCAIFLFLAALDYDYGFLRNMKRINAAGVDIELSERPAERVGGVSPGTFSDAIDSAELLKGPFPGARALDYAIGGLESLARFAQRDEQYALLLAGQDPGRVKGSNDIEGSARAFAIYAENEIVPIAERLDRLQAFHRSETSVLSVEPSAVAALRRTYLRSRAGYELTEADDALYGVRAALAELTQAIRTRVHYWRPVGLGVADAVLLAHQIANDIAEEYRSYSSLLDERTWTLGPALLRAAVTIARENDALAATAAGGAKGADQRAAFCVRLARESETLGKSDLVMCSGYLALTVAYAETAVGNAENAMHILEIEINQGRKAVNSAGKPEAECGNEGTDQADCAAFALSDVEWARRAILLQRLEAAQLGLIDLRQSHAFDDIFVNRAKRLVDDGELIFQRFKKASEVRKAYFKTGGESRSVDACGAGSDQPASLRNQLLLRIVAAQLLIENNALYSVAFDPRLVPRNPRLVDELDRFAEDVSGFDFDCVKAAGLKADWRLPAYFLDSAAGYWAAKGEQFGISDKDFHRLKTLKLDSSTKVKALCRAERLRFAAAKAFEVERTADSPKTPTSTAVEDALDDDAQNAVDQDFPLVQQAGVDRIDRDLSDFPDAEKASACAGG